MRIKTLYPTSRRRILALALACCASIPAFLQATVIPSNSAALEWNPNPEPDITGYKVYIGSVSGTYATVINVVGAAWTTLPSVPLGSTLYLAVSAYNTSGLESPRSAELVVTADVPKPAAATSFTLSSAGNGQLQWKYPKNASIPPDRFTVYASEDLVNWNPTSEILPSASASSDAQWLYFAFPYVSDKPRMFFLVGASNAFGESR
jgi:hypothetical protein